MVTDEMKNKNVKHIYKVHKDSVKKNIEIVNCTAINHSHTSLIDDRMDRNGGRTSDREHKLEVPEMENT